MQQEIVLWVNTHLTIVIILSCLIGVPLLIAECWWFVRVFRGYLRSERELRDARQERRREFKMNMIRLWASIRRAEEWNVDTTEAKETLDSILDCRDESSHLDTLLFFTLFPTIMSMLFCFATAWISTFILEIAMALFALSCIWLAVGLTWYQMRLKAFKVKYVYNS